MRDRVVFHKVFMFMTKKRSARTDSAGGVCVYPDSIVNRKILALAGEK